MARASEETGKRRRKARASQAPSPGAGFRLPMWRAAMLRPLRWAARGALAVLAALLVLLLLFIFVNPPVTITMLQERQRLGAISRQWVPAAEVAPVMLRAVVAAEDANFCRHWGFDMREIRRAIDAGSNRGASTLSQQVVKNVFLWQGRSWGRKAMEAGLTPVTELLWSKRRILEIYVNVAEFGEGIFGVHAAAAAYFGTTPDRLTARQAALLAAVLPSPKTRDAARPSEALSRRARAIEDGAATIRADGRAACFGG